MTRALVTQMLEGLESGLAYVENEANQLTTREYKAAITAAREYLSTEPSGERAELIQWLRERSACDGMLQLSEAADMLEADAQQAKRVPMTEPEDLYALALKSDNWG